MNFAEMWVIWTPRTVLRARLPKRHHFVGFMKDHSPISFPITDPGLYELDVQEISPKATWPVLVAIIKTKHVPMFERMSAEAATKVWTEACAAAKSARKPLPASQEVK